MGGTCKMHERDETCIYKVLVGKPEGKRPLRRPRRRWEDDIKTDFKEIVWQGVDWIRTGTSGVLL
jgi:hypothetical protein